MSGLRRLECFAKDCGRAEQQTVCRRNLRGNLCRIRRHHIIRFYINIARLTDTFGNFFRKLGRIILRSTVTDEEGYMRATKYYFDNILGPFKQPYMTKALALVRSLDIDMICPGHGPVLAVKIAVDDIFQKANRNRCRNDFCTGILFQYFCDTARNTKVWLKRGRGQSHLWEQGAKPPGFYKSKNIKEVIS